MNYIDSNGDYVFKAGTKRLDDSDHPVHHARIEIALGQGQWICAPQAGHELARFARMKQSAANVDEFKKELSYYLSKYDPATQSILVDRPGVDLELKIPPEALHV